MILWKEVGAQRESAILVVCEYAHGNPPMEAKRGHWVSCSTLSAYTPERGLWLNLELPFWLGGLASYSEICLYLHMVLCLAFLHGYLGFKLRPLCLLSKHLPTDPFPSLYFTILKQKSERIRVRKSKLFAPAKWECLFTSSSPCPSIWITREDGGGWETEEAHTNC